MQDLQQASDTDLLGWGPQLWGCSYLRSPSLSMVRVACAQHAHVQHTCASIHAQEHSLAHLYFLLPYRHQDLQSSTACMPLSGFLFSTTLHGIQHVHALKLRRMPTIGTEVAVRVCELLH